MKKKSLIYVATAAIIAAMVQTPVLANPVEAKVTQSQIDATQGKINDFETKIQKLDNQISVGMVKSQQLDDSIKSQQEKITETKAEIEKAQKDLDAHKLVYSERLKSIQSEGQQPIVTYAEVLLNSKDISDFLTRFTAISEIIQSDTDLLNGLNQKEQALKDAGEKLHTELDNLNKSQAELAAQQKQIEADKKEVEKELADAKTNLKNQKDQLAQQQAAEEKARQEAILAAKKLAEQQAIAQQQAQQHSSVSSSASSSSASASVATLSSSGSASASAVIAKAEQYLGVPYVWGGSSPSGFDCSGLMQYVFHSVGINLPRVAADQQNVGTRISPSDVQPGDLVFKGSPAYHVGMYIGNGEWIQAPQTGDVVKISAYNPAKFSSAARVLR